MSSRWWTLGAWALVAAAALYWGLKLFVTPAALPSQTQWADSGPRTRGDLTRLLGADVVVVEAAAPEPAADARYQLVGVVSPRPPRAGGEGLALIAVDGKPAKAFRVGTVVDGERVLQAVGPRSASLGPRGGAAQIALNIAPPTPAATMVLPPAGTGAQSSVDPPIATGPRPNLINRGAAGSMNSLPNFSGRRQPAQFAPPSQPMPQPVPLNDAPEPAHGAEPALR
jgi:general secretion pathway protein C